MKDLTLRSIIVGFGVLASQLAFGQKQAATVPSQITITTTPADGSAATRIAIPADVQVDTLSITLNGNEVGSRFTRVDCPQGSCEQTTFTEPDGLRTNKNVLQVLAKRNDGTIISARERFAGGITAVPAARARIAGSAGVHTNAVAALPTLSSFLPPAIAFTTLVAGGYNGTAWIQVGTQNPYPANPSNFVCGDVYSVIVLDRQTLQEKTAVPESSPQCIADGIHLKTYLETLNSSDLVIVGTNFGHNTDASFAAAQFDTSSIGGTVYNCSKANNCTPPTNTVGSSDSPLGYIAIGVGGAASGSAFENYYVPDSWAQVNPHATGMLVEDSNGNYNFQPSTAIEYTVVPNDPNNTGVSTITVGSVPGDPYYTKNLLSKVYTPPGGTGQNGMWMLILQRSTLFSVPFDISPAPPVANQDACTQTSTSGTVAVFHGCGVFYDTGDSNATNATNAYKQLTSDLQSAVKNPSELVFLVSIGNQPGYPDTDGVKLIASGLGTAFSQMGGTPETLTNLNTPGSTYSYVGCSGCGNSLGGNVVISTNLQSQQGQNGYIHGLLEPNLNGIYWPTQASLDQPSSDGKPTTDFTIQEVTSTPPVEWPELSNTQKLAVSTGSSTTYTADTTGGQNAAYYYISYQLINQHYIIGAQGNYIDDIHYYFTGGNNTFLDYHTFDPANLTFPGSSPSACYSWTDPVAGRGTLCFTQNDFNAVRAQMHNEIVYLTNVMQYTVTGSTNMKDIVASGSGSAASALINAAASIQASTLQPPPATPVKASISNILNFVGNIVSVAAAVATGGLSTSTEDAAKTALTILGPSAGATTGFFGMASAATGSGGLGSGSNGSAALPSKNYTFLTTIGNLSNNSLQQTFTAGFDTGLDTIFGDWYKLSTIGPKITDSNYPAFQSPNQIAQLIGAQQIGQASQRTFYMALLPINYSVQHYTYWFGRPGVTNYPDMGGRTDGNFAHCNTWYYSGSAPSTINLVSKSYGSYSDEGPAQFGFYYGDEKEVPIPNPLDWFLIASSATPTDHSTGSQRIQLLDSQVANTLFSSGQLNIPLDAFLDQNGPMASVWNDSASSGFDGFPALQTCSLYVATTYGSTNPSASSPTGLQPNAVQVTLKIPAIGVLGDNIALKATAAVTSGPVTAGTIAFSDGGTEIGRSALDSTGTATLPINTLTLGLHTISASFVASTQYTASSPVTAPLVIYANDADLAISPSAGSMTVTSGATSSPLSLRVTSKWGLAGPVTFTCSGLPSGATCSFSPSQVTLTDGTSGTTSLTITSKTQTAELRSSSGVFAAMLLPLSLLILRRKRIAIRSLTAVVLMGMLASLGTFIGCASGPSAPATQPSSSTVLVTATSGNISRSVPINVTVQ